MTSQPESPTILVVDDDREIRYSLERVLTSRHFRVVTAGSGEEGLDRAGAEDPEVVFLDFRMEGLTGIETLQRLRSIQPKAMVILMTAYGTTQTAIEAMKFGAFDYIIKPFDIQKVLGLIESARQARRDLEEVTHYKPALNSEDYEEGIVGRSEPMQEVFKVIGQVAASEATVLITGESGTGKELVARCIHQHSLRGRENFVAVNCAAIPDNLIESELFGHERGAFTGATGQRIGKFEECDGGTIFLDEIGDMALPTQTKILRVLQDGEIRRVGGSSTVKVDVRVLAATNRDLERMVQEKTFREDLYYRLNVVRMRLPPLRERMEDLPLLVDFLLQKLSKTRKTEVTKVAPEAMALLRRHSWPGNVRELENTVYRSAVLAQGDAILIRDLPEDLRDGEVPPSSSPEAFGKRPATDAPSAIAMAPDRRATDVVQGGGSQANSELEPDRRAGGDVFLLERPEVIDRVYEVLRGEEGKDLLGHLEREMIIRALKETNGNQVKASAILGITRTTLRKRIDQLQLK